MKTAKNKNEHEKHSQVGDATIWLHFETDEKDLDPLELDEEERSLIEYRQDSTDEKAA